MNIDDFCTNEGCDEYLQIKNYILQNSACFETKDAVVATKYLNEIESYKKGMSLNNKITQIGFDGLYVIKENDIYQFIQP
jgi:hypothetical protein